MFQMLDKRDDTIQEQSGMIGRLKERMLEQEELVSATMRTSHYENQGGEGGAHHPLPIRPLHYPLLRLRPKTSASSAFNNPSYNGNGNQR